MILIIYRYILQYFLLYVGVFFFSIAGIILFFDIIELLRLSFKIQDLDVKTVFLMGFLRNYYHANKIWPFIILLSALFTYKKLSENFEIYILRAAGLSTFQLLMPVIIGAFLIGIIHITICNPLGAKAISQYQNMEAVYLKHKKSSISFSGSGLWLKEERENESIIFHALRIAQDTKSFHDVTFFYHNKDNAFVKRIDGRKAIIENKKWIVNDIRTMNTQYEIETTIKFEIETDLTFESIMDSILSPETLSFWQLYTLLIMSDNHILTSPIHHVYLYQLIATPIYFSFITLLGYAFGVKKPRDMRNGYIITAAVFAQFVIYFIGDFIATLAKINMLPIFFAAICPLIITFIIGFYSILNREFS